jgi:hypothetical protein
MGLVIVKSPSDPVYRVGRAPDPLQSPPWKYAISEEDHPLYGTFGNRFDDPSGRWGEPTDRRYQVIYLCTQPDGAFGETIARFRPSLKLIAQLSKTDDFNSIDPTLRGGVIPATWPLDRRLGVTTLNPSLRFADLEASETIHTLRRSPEIAAAAAALGIADIDYGEVNGLSRPFTQLVARYIYRLTDEDGIPIFNGLRYGSRLNLNGWDCWAVYQDRMIHTPEIPIEISLDNPHLRAAADLLGLKIEAKVPSGISTATCFGPMVSGSR